MEKERFTMLLLEPGEIFFEDYSVQMKQESEDSSKVNWTDGRLKLCSKSLVFVDKDLNKPLIKIQLRETISVTKINSFDITSGGNDVLAVQCKQYVNMLEGNILAPYKFIHKNTRFLFSFNYAKVDTDCLPQTLQLLRAATLPMAEQNAMIMTIVHSKQSRVSFDRSWLEDLYEAIVLEVQANKVLPLIINPGRILLTSCRLYFQPYNNMDQHPVLKINLKDIKKVIKRRFLLRQIGLEIQWTRPTDGKSDYLFLSLKNSENRDNLYDNLLNQSEVNLDMIPQNQMTIQWQNGSVTNFDYLLYINSLADRTFHDLTQYPVMPWILSDYFSETLDLNDPNVYRDLTKPIGAIELSRLNKLKERYNEMSEPKFLYGSHYSAPGFVLFYLVRKYPRYMLCLQNGRFDHPDRMFNNVSDVWKNVQSNMFDFKELIPEFYDITNEGDFLINKYGIDFGYRFDGTKVGDVQLPPWAHGPAHFVETLRNALESDWVSQNLHHWIDLIFGYKQKGIEAEKANNVFFHLCYEGAVDLDTIKDPNDKHGLEVQIMEFGQIPKQVFTLPHPKRLSSTTIDLLCENILSIQNISTNEENFNLTEALSFNSHKETVTAVAFVNNNLNCDDIVSVSHDGTARFYSLKTKKLTRTVNLSAQPLSSCVTYRLSNNRPVLVVGSWDNTIIFYDIEFGKVTNTLQGHEDAVSCVKFSNSHKIIISGSWDCAVKIWQLHETGTNIKLRRNLVAQLDNECKVTTINISKDETLLVSGTEEGEIFLWDIKTYNLQFMVKGHNGKINDITFESESRNIVCCASDKVISVIDIMTSTQINLTTLKDEPLCLAWDGSFLLIGDSKGFINVWNFHTVMFLRKCQCHNGSLNSIVLSPDNKWIVTGGKDKAVKIWERN